VAPCLAMAPFLPGSAQWGLHNLPGARTFPCTPSKLGAPPWILLWRLSFLITCKKENHGGRRQTFKTVINVGLAADVKNLSQAEKTSL